jgi:hypothetical protein
MNDLHDSCPVREAKAVLIAAYNHFGNQIDEKALQNHITVL